MDTSALEMSLEEADRAFEESLAYGLFVTDSAVVLMTTVEHLRNALQAAWDGDFSASEEIPKCLYQKMWKEAHHLHHAAYDRRLQALGRAIAVRREMIEHMERT